MTEVLGTILIVVTSCGQMENGEPTGLWLEEFSVPYEIFVEGGYAVTVVSPNGGQVPVDARSLAEGTLPPNSEKAIKLLQNVGVLKDIDQKDFDAVFFPGGHGTMFDMPEDEKIHDVVRSFVESDRPSAFVCHGPAALVGVQGADGEPLVRGKTLTGFTNAEEEAVQLTEAMPFLLETKLKELGATFHGKDNFASHVVEDGNLITGQNPASSKAAAEMLLKQLQ